MLFRWLFADTLGDFIISIGKKLACRASGGP
jgi:hypothetical protein